MENPKYNERLISLLGSSELIEGKNLLEVIAIMFSRPAGLIVLNLLVTDPEKKKIIAHNRELERCALKLMKESEWYKADLHPFEFRYWVDRRILEDKVANLYS